MEEMEILKDDKDFKVLLLVLFMLTWLILNLLSEGCNIEQPHTIYDSIYMGWDCDYYRKRNYC